MAIIGIRPTVDVVFKCIFGSEGHPALTQVLLNAVLPVIGSSRVTKTRLQNPFSFAEFESDKEIVVDVHVRDEHDNEYQIEMQVEYHANLPRRVHDNWARLYQRQIGEGQRYGDHRPLVCVWIVDEDIPDRLRWLDGVHSSWISDNERYSREFFVIFLQLGRWRTLNSGDHESTRAHLMSDLPHATFSEEEREDVGRLASFLSDSQNWDDERLPEGMGNSWVGEALKIMKTFTSDDAARDLYERRLEAERVHEDLILTGVQRGIAIGKLEGKLEGKNDALRETARQLKMLGIATGTIAQATGLSLEDLRKL